VNFVVLQMTRSNLLHSSLSCQFIAPTGDLNQDTEFAAQRSVHTWSQATRLRGSGGRQQTHPCLCPLCSAPVFALTRANHAILSTSVRGLWVASLSCSRQVFTLHPLQLLY
jgi:hypothetical protein